MSELIVYLQNMNQITYIILLFIILPASLFLTRKSYFNIFDPTAAYIIMNSFAICLVVYMYLYNDIGIKSLSIFILNQFFFWMGHLFIINKYKPMYSQHLTIIMGAIRRGNVFIGIVLMTMLLVTASVLLFVSRGVPILAENPGEAKVLLYEGGFGPVRYIQINFIPILIGLTLLAIILGAVNNKKNILMHISNIRYIIVLLLVVLLLVTMGSKSSLLAVITFLSMGLYYLKTCNNTLAYKKLINIAYVMFVFAVCYLILIAFFESGSLDEVVFHIIIRFIASGDVFFFYYKYNLTDYYINYNLIDYAKYVINPIASVLKLDNYDFPLGAEILHLATGWPLSAFGPNAQFPVIGDIFFGPFFSWLYSMILGLVVGYLRIGSISILSRCGAFGSTLYLYLWSFSISLALDLTLFIQCTFMFFLFATPIYFFTYLISRVARCSHNLPISSGKSADLF